MGGLSRRKGAEAERAAVRCAVAHGVAAQRVIRTATSREPDHGDIHLQDGRIVVQVKSGAAAKTATPTTIHRWLVEANMQAQHVTQADAAILLRQVHGTGLTTIGLWQVHISADDLWWPRPAPDYTLALDYTSYLNFLKQVG
jgi:homogentisate 1,2-dioxygenase